MAPVVSVAPVAPVKVSASNNKFVKIHPPKTKAARRGPAEVIFPVFVTYRTFLFFFRRVRVFPERRKRKNCICNVQNGRVRVQLCIQ